MVEGIEHTRMERGLVDVCSTFCTCDNQSKFKFIVWWFILITYFTQFIHIMVYRK